MCSSKGSNAVNKGRAKVLQIYFHDGRLLKLYTATLIIAKAVIPAKAGIQKNTGFRVKPGMTNRIRLMSSCIEHTVGCFDLIHTI